MIKNMIIASLIMIPISAVAAETVAKVKATEWSISVVAEGVAWENSCKLKLIASEGKRKKEINLKREETGCLLLGPAHLEVSESTDNQAVTVFFEADRGDDSHNTGPIVEVFRLNKSAIKKLGEQRIFDATYIRQNGQIASVTGKALFSLCPTCEYPVSLTPEENFYIPVKLTIGKGGISVEATLSQQERKNLMAKFEAQAKAGAKENEEMMDYKEFISGIRHELRSLLKL